MITCPNCNHQNPEGALQCEACYTPLPAMVSCPSCHTPVQADASFCGQCGNDLRGLNLSEQVSGSSESGGIHPTQASNLSGSNLPDSEMKTQNFLVTEPDTSAASAPSAASTVVSGSVSGSMSGSVSGEWEESSLSSLEVEVPSALPDQVELDPLVIPDPIGGVSGVSGASMGGAAGTNELETSEAESPPVSSPEATPEAAPAANAPEPVAPEPTPAAAPDPLANVPAASSAPPPRPMQATQLQTLSSRLRQVQTNTTIEIPRQLSLVRIGKPNDQMPPDIDVSGFPDSEVVSRVHANLRVEGDTYYIEDVGSSNGTYINGLPLAVGNRHRLRPGDRIALGKGDKVSFVFETA
jgi:hypothetical protein